MSELRPLVNVNDSLDSHYSVKNVQDSTFTIAYLLYLSSLA